MAFCVLHVFCVSMVSSVSLNLSWLISEEIIHLKQELRGPSGPSADVFTEASYWGGGAVPKSETKLLWPLAEEHPNDVCIFFVVVFAKTSALTFICEYE